MKTMNMSETSKLILDLRVKGWGDAEMVNRILYTVNGEDAYTIKRKDD